MDVLQLLITSVSFLAFCILFFGRYFSYVRLGLRLPPGPRGLPLIGHLHLLSSLPHRSLQKLSQRYGPIMFLRFGLVQTVVVSNAEMAKEILKTHDGVFASRPYLLMGEYSAYNFKNMALASYGEHWRNMRRLCITQLFTPKRLESYAGIRKQEVGLLISALLKSSSNQQQPVQLKELLKSLSFNIITRIVMRKTYFGTAATDQSSEARRFTQLMEEAAVISGSFNVGDFIPWMRKYDWNIPRIKKLHHDRDEFLEAILDEHRNMKNNNLTREDDFVDIMFEHFRKDEDDCIKALLQDLLAAGTETSATLLEWAVGELIHNPEIIKKAQDEIEHVVGNDRLVEETDLVKLEYLQAIVKETFRLHPPLPLLIPHQATQDCNVAGYHIPKGATVFVNIYAIGRDLSYWKDPDQFQPDRFLGSSLDVRGKDFELLPFGSGRRACPGLLLGMRTVELTLSNLIHAFEWSFGQGKCSHPMTETLGTVNWMETPLQPFVVPRLSTTAYIL